jgi:MFS family permease
MVSEVSKDEKIQRNFDSIWRLYFANFFLLAIVPVNIDNLILYLPGTTLLGIGLMASTGLLVGIVSILFYGYFSDKISEKYSRKNIFAINCSLWIITAVLSIISPNFLFLYILIFFSAFGSGAILPIAFAIIGDTYPPKERGKRFGSMQFSLIAGYGSGMIVGLIIGNSFGSIGWRLAYVVGAIIGALMLISYWMQGFDPERGAAEPEFLGYDGEISYDYRITLGNLKGIFKSKTLTAIYLQILFAGIATTTLGTWGIFYFTNKLAGENAKLYATLLSLLIGAGALPGSILGGKLGDKFYESGKVKGRVVVTLLGLTIGILCIMGFYLLPIVSTTTLDLVISLIIMSILGFFGYMMGSFNVGNQYAIFSEVCVPELRGAANALSGVLVNIGGIIGNLMLSSMIDQDISLLTTAVTLVLSIWFIGSFIWIIPYFTYPKEARLCRDTLADRRIELDNKIKKD